MADKQKTSDSKDKENFKMLMYDGERAFKKRSYTQAKDSFMNAATLAKDNGDKEHMREAGINVFNTFIHLGLEARSKGEFHRAASWYDEAENRGRDFDVGQKLVEQAKQLKEEAEKRFTGKLDETGKKGQSKQESSNSIQIKEEARTYLDKLTSDPKYRDNPEKQYLRSPTIPVFIDSIIATYSGFFDGHHDTEKAAERIVNVIAMSDSEKINFATKPLAELEQFVLFEHRDPAQTAAAIRKNLAENRNISLLVARRMVASPLESKDDQMRVLESLTENKSDHLIIFQSAAKASLASLKPVSPSQNKDHAERPSDQPTVEKSDTRTEQPTDQSSAAAAAQKNQTKQPGRMRAMAGSAASGVASTYQAVRQAGLARRQRRADRRAAAAAQKQQQEQNAMANNVGGQAEQQNQRRDQNDQQQRANQNADQQQNNRERNQREAQNNQQNIEDRIKAARIEQAKISVDQEWIRHIKDYSRINVSMGNRIAAMASKDGEKDIHAAFTSETMNMAQALHMYEFMMIHWRNESGVSRNDLPSARRIITEEDAKAYHRQHLSAYSKFNLGEDITKRALAPDNNNALFNLVWDKVRNQPDSYYLKTTDEQNWKEIYERFLAYAAQNRQETEAEQPNNRNPVPPSAPIAQAEQQEVRQAA